MIYIPVHVEAVDLPLLHGDDVEHLSLGVDLGLPVRFITTGLTVTCPSIL